MRLIYLAPLCREGQELRAAQLPFENKVSSAIVAAVPRQSPSPRKRGEGLRSIHIRQFTQSGTRRCVRQEVRSTKADLISSTSDSGFSSRAISEFLAVAVARISSSSFS